MEESIVEKMLDLMRRGRQCEEVEHGKLATPVAIPTSAAALRAIPAQLQRSPLFVTTNPLHASLPTEACIARHAHNQRPLCLIRLVLMHCRRPSAGRLQKQCVVVSNHASPSTYIGAVRIN